jgi:hypothetical protein
MSATPDQCMQDLRALTQRYIQALGDDCGESVHHGVCTSLMFIEMIAGHAKTEVEFRMILGKTMLDLADECFSARLPKVEAEDAEEAAP